MNKADWINFSAASDILRTRGVDPLTGLAAIVREGGPVGPRGHGRGWLVPNLPRTGLPRDYGWIETPSLDPEAGTISIAIRGRRRGEVSRRAFTLLVNRHEIDRRWPGGPEVYESGAAGRPTSVGLVRNKMRERAASGSLFSKLADEAQFLKEWLSGTHPAAPSMTAKTIENQLRSEFKDARNKAAAG